MNISSNKLELISPEGLRVDGRRNLDRRSFNCNSIGGNRNPGNPLLPLADGSCYLEIGNTKLIAAVYGPKECQNRLLANPNAAILNVEFSVASFASMTTSSNPTRQGNRDKRLLEIGMTISKSLSVNTLLSLYPKSQIDVFIQVLQSDGGLLAAGINAATLALIDAGISMSDYTAACTVGFDQNSKSVLVDLNYMEEGSECGMLTVAVDRATGKLTSLGLECRVHLQWLEEMMKVGKDACLDIAESMDSVIRSMVFPIVNTSARDRPPCHLQKLIKFLIFADTTFAPQPATERGRGIQLSVDPKGKTFSYTNGRSVIMRDLENPGIASEYTGHTSHATVARWSPSGFYMASGDVQGNVRIWDTVNSEHILKIETRPFAGKINDLAWDFESKRLICVGEGKDKFGHAFLWDTGSSCGEIIGHSKAVNSITMRPGRPMRAVTASDDFSVNFYHGVPFKFVKSNKEHSRFVQCVRYSPNGNHFVSSSSDAKIILYDGKEGDKIGEFTENAHSGTVFSVSWDGEGSKILSASADMTAKIWDVSTMKCVNTIKFSERPTFEQQQVGSLWSGSYLITASLNGDLNYLDPRTNTPSKVIKGHQKSITSLARMSESTFYSGSYDGRVLGWSIGGNGGEEIKNGHTNSVTGLGKVGDDDVYSCGMDDTVRLVSSKEKSYKSGVSFSTGSTPKDLAVCKNTAAVITANQIQVYQNSALLKSISITGFTPTAVAIDPSGMDVAVGGDDMKVHFYSISSGTSTGLTIEGNRGEITCLAYSPDNKYLAVGDSNSKILVFDPKNGILLFDQWVFHSSRINSVSWNQDSVHAVSTSLDTNVEIWSTVDPMKHISIKNAHLESATAASFLDEKTIVSVGGDAFIRTWKIQF